MRLSVLACPECHGVLVDAAEGARCGSCARNYPRSQGFLDLFTYGPAMVTGLGPLMLRDPQHVPRYEPYTRPAFLKLMGGNWDDALTTADEDAYLRRNVALADGLPGPVVDLACGAGRWTRVVAETLGTDRTIGLDLSVAMLTAIAQAIPQLSVVRASALALPFANDSLAAVNCWNALQVLPDPPAVLAEVGRCLQPGGIFTALTFRHAASPLYRYFQERHEQAFRVRSFAVTDIVGWLTDNRLSPVDVSGPGTFLLITARKS